MRRILIIAACTAAACGAIFARSGRHALASEALAPGPQSGAASAASGGDTKIIDLKSDLSGPVAPGDSVIFLVGNFAAQHNGAVITCDSAVRYSDKRIEFFGNVLINKNTTYIYGDRADYNGEINEARVYSDIIKVVDGDATLYTYRFRFNTKDNVGEFAQGGVLINRDNVLESVRGYYYADTKELAAVEQVEMRNEEYELKGDSVVYNMATDNAFFFDRTNIWSHDGNYLYADRGEYRKADTLYVVTRNGYVLTAEQEMWSDSIDFYRAENHVILRRDIQIDDAPHKVLAFADYGEYWREPGNAFLTRNPSLVSYDLSQGDSLFMRADSMFLYTVRWEDEKREQEAAADAGNASESGRPERGADSLRGPVPQAGGRSIGSLPRPDSLGHVELPDSLRAAGAADSLGVARAVDSLGGADTVRLSAAERKALLKEEARKAREVKKKAAAEAKKELLAEIAARRQAKKTAKLLAQKEREEARLTARRLKAESKLRARQARAARRGKPLPVDSTALREIDDRLARNAGEQDSLLGLLFARWAADSVEVAATVDSLALLPPRDSIYRLMKGYRNVRIYRSDFQSVCDSITALSADSTIHLYIDPVLWNQSNQITSELMDIYTRNSQIERAEFVGSPMMVSEIDTVHYNQIAGKEMTAYFRNNEIWLDNVNGNAQTLYYNQDGEPPQVTGLFFVESGGINFYVDEQQVVRMSWYNEPRYSIYPMDKIPPEQELYLKGFKWEGARRPSQRDVFDRSVRPSERAERSALAHPSFPLRQRIDEHRRMLTEQRRWADRVDRVDPATVEWMRELGFEVGQPREGGPKF
ncbi:MAG: hypothetical protein K2N04_02470 [Alistipes sp.]|nr:hypothetical protein [Alistipes sp.]